MIIQTLICLIYLLSTYRRTRLPHSPGLPTSPSGPVAPAKPGGPDKPGKPRSPGFPAGPTRPGTPEAPGPPGPPGNPRGPEGPVDPCDPGPPNGPGLPVAPILPRSPGTPKHEKMKCAIIRPGWIQDEAHTITSRPQGLRTGKYSLLGNTLYLFSSLLEAKSTIFMIISYCDTDRSKQQGFKSVNKKTGRKRREAERLLTWATWATGSAIKTTWSRKSGRS